MTKQIGNRIWKCMHHSPFMNKQRWAHILIELGKLSKCFTDISIIQGLSNLWQWWPQLLTACAWGVWQKASDWSRPGDTRDCRAKTQSAGGTQCARQHLGLDWTGNVSVRDPSTAWWRRSRTRISLVHPFLRCSKTDWVPPARCAFRQSVRCGDMAISMVTPHLTF